MPPTPEVSARHEQLRWSWSGRFSPGDSTGAATFTLDVRSAAAIVFTKNRERFFEGEIARKFFTPVLEQGFCCKV